MSNFALLAEELIGGFAYAVENGTTVDNDTVSTTYLPDVTPVDNWPWMGCIEAVRFSDERSTDPIACPKATGGYEILDREKVDKVYIDLVLRNANEWTKRLQYGLGAAIVAGTAQTPFTETLPEITGWLKLQGRQQDGTDAVRMDVWCKFRLQEIPNWENSYGKPVLRCQPISGSDFSSFVVPA